MNDTEAQGTRVARNTVLVFATRVGVLAVTFAVSLAVAWKLGDEALGDYGLMIAYWFVTQQAAALGLTYLLPRRIAQHPDATRPLVFGAMVIAVPAALLFAGGLAALGAGLGYDPLRRELLSWVAVALLPGAVTQVGEAVFLAQERGNALATVQTTEHGMRGILSLVVLSLGGDLIDLAHLLVGTRFVGLAATLWLLRGHLTGGALREMPAAIRGLLRDLPIYAALYAASAVFLRIDVVMLSVLSDKDEMGFYVAAYRIFDAAAVIPATAALVVFPVLARLWAGDRGAEAALASRSLTGVWITLIPIVLGLSMGAPGLMDFLYSEAFAAAAPVLAVLALGLLPGAVEKLLGHTMVAVERERINLWMVVTAALAAMLLHRLLIPAYGALGAAMASVGATAVLAGVNWIYVQREMFRVRIGRELLRAIPATLGCALFLRFTAEGHPLWTLPTATLVYVVLARAFGAIRPGFSKEMLGRDRGGSP